ncbi:hypothetical protein B484DRAFT_454265 [Ochromonadaceae sp. CCMP2298]|nr:hypothetical protein B484DRAFT_454265 [Ochromonadaceae sp. CCMP2298]|mmetsp:Transcript_34738/g.76618  ORF Transcript_34738/g.76618 Transcript_34738/m.76618 type:complete len:323 (-) Transcript_34738:381-1349(-)
MSFKYILIPADETKPVVQLEASKSGGLEQDALRISAESAFTSDINHELREKAVAKDLQAKGIDPSKVADFLNGSDGARMAGSVEIISLCLPTAANGFKAVSMYCDGNSAFRGEGQQQNLRATAVLRACGHTSMVVVGSAFMGRAMDDERVEWERLDFVESDLGLQSAWVLETAKFNAGKDMGKYTTSGTMQNITNTQAAQATQAKAQPALEEKEFEGDEYTWTQTDEEVEVRMKLPEGLLAKQLAVKISAAGLKISRKNGGPVEGLHVAFAGEDEASTGAALFAPINAADSTWSVAEEREGRIFTASLAKKSSSSWKSLLKL